MQNDQNYQQSRPLRNSYKQFAPKGPCMFHQSSMIYCMIYRMPASHHRRIHHKSPNKRTEIPLLVVSSFHHVASFPSMVALWYSFRAIAMVSSRASGLSRLNRGTAVTYLSKSCQGRSIISANRSDD